MNFTVTYRKNDGALATEVIDAADRAAVIAACRARGIVPTSVTQGGRHAPSKPRNPSWLKGAIAGVLVAAIAGGALWWFGRGEATPSTKEKPKKVKVEKPERKQPAKPAKSDTGNARPQVAATDTKKPTPSAEPQKPAIDTNITDRARMIWRGRKARAWDVATNGVNITEMIVTDDDGRRHRIERKVPGVIPSMTDQLLLMSLSDIRGDGAPMPSLGESSDADFLESLKTPIVINEGDSDEVRKIKETLIAARQEMKELMDKGWTFKKVLSEHVEQAKANTQLRIEALRTYKEVSKEYDPKTAQEFLEKTNTMLREQGIEEIKPSQNGGRRREANEQH